MDGSLRSLAARWAMMPTLTLEPRDSCALCGCRLRGFSIGTYRINRGSMRSNRGSISWLECPECGPTFARRHPTGVPNSCDHWRLDVKSQAMVDEFRARKGWD